MARSTVSSDVFAPATTSTSGTMCGGLNGWPTTHRSGYLHADCITLIVSPDELDAMIESLGVAASMSENNLTFKSFHAASMYRRRFASAFGAGSVATTLRPRARYRAAQLAPMTPVPTIATFRISWPFVV